MSLNLSKNLFPSAEKIRAATTVSPLMMIDRNKLEFHPRNTEIYSVEVDDLFINNIAENGVIEPLIVIKNKDDDKYTICSGNRRFTAVQEVIKRNIPLAEGVKLDTIPCIVWDLPDYEDADVDLLINANLHNRKKTDGEIAKELAIKKEILLKRKQNGEKINGRVLDILAEQLEITAQQAKRLNAININAADEVKDAFADGKISTDTAYQLSKADSEKQKEIIATAGKAGEKLTAKVVKEALAPEKNVIEDKKVSNNISQIDTKEKSEEAGTTHNNNYEHNERNNSPANFPQYTDVEPQPIASQLVIPEQQKENGNSEKTVDDVTEETDEILNNLNYLINEVFSFDCDNITVTKEQANGIAKMLNEIKSILE